MTPITERLAEALLPCPNGHEAKMHRCKYGVDSLYASGWFYVDCEIKECGWHCGGFPTEVEAAAHWNLRTHPAEGGDGRDYEATLACPRCGRRRTTGAGRLPDWPACCNLVCHCTCHNDPLYCRECKNCDCHKAAPLPQPVAPAEGGEGRDYVLVPREPTEAMVSAGFDVHPCRTGETKVTDAYKAMLAAAPPPQPVAPEPKSRSQAKRFAALAPERGEAKAVAPGNGSFQIGWYNTKYKAFFKMDEQDSTGRTHEMLLDGEIIRVYANATPQPPPAPRFRDPTIEDVRLFKEEYRSGLLSQEPEDNIVLKAMQRMGIVLPLNAIGAKVEERP